MKKKILSKKKIIKKKNKSIRQKNKNKYGSGHYDGFEISDRNLSDDKYINEINGIEFIITNLGNKLRECELTKKCDEIDILNDQHRIDEKRKEMGHLSNLLFGIDKNNNKICKAIKDLKLNNLIEQHIKYRNAFEKKDLNRSIKEKTLKTFSIYRNTFSKFFLYSQKLFPKKSLQLLEKFTNVKNLGNLDFENNDYSISKKLIDARNSLINNLKTFIHTNEGFNCNDEKYLSEKSHIDLPKNKYNVTSNDDYFKIIKKFLNNNNQPINKKEFGNNEMIKKLINDGILRENNGKIKLNTNLPNDNIQSKNKPTIEIIKYYLVNENNLPIEKNILKQQIIKKKGMTENEFDESFDFLVQKSFLITKDNNLNPFSKKKYYVNLNSYSLRNFIQNYDKTLVSTFRLYKRNSLLDHAVKGNIRYINDNDDDKKKMEFYNFLLKQDDNNYYINSDEIVPKPENIKDIKEHEREWVYLMYPKIGQRPGDNPIRGDEKIYVFDKKNNHLIGTGWWSDFAQDKWDIIRSLNGGKIIRKKKKNIYKKKNL